MMDENVWIVVPAYNEEPCIGGVLDGLRRQGFNQVIVVDDGSRDRTGEIASSKGAHVVVHRKNLGLGSALRTGVNEAIKMDAEVIVTFDADGQHDPRAIPRLLAALNDADIAVGIRNRFKMPRNKRFGNSALDILTYFLGGPLMDSQSGFRALGERAINTIRIRGQRYEVSSEILIQASEKGLKIRGIPIKGIFTEYSMARSTTIASGIRIFFNLLRLKVTNRK